jgi:hypothetical protein
LAHLDINPGADKAVSILAELIKAGRYTPGGVSIADMMKETATIKKQIEELYSDKST